MSDDDVLWAEFDAAPLNLFVYDPEPGLWCPQCNLPGRIRYKIGTDPSDPLAGVFSGSTYEWCTECRGRER